MKTTEEQQQDGASKAPTFLAGFLALIGLLCVAYVMCIILYNLGFQVL